MSEKRKPALGFIFITLLLDVIGFGIIVPVLPKLITEVIHGDLSDASLYAGWFMFAFSIMQFLFAPIVGNLSDRFGRRPVILLSLLGFVINYILLAFTSSVVLFFMGRLMAGIMGASFTAGTAYIADISTPEKRSQNFGLIGMAFGVGFIIGPVMGGVLGQFGTRVPFIAAAIITFINFVYGYFILPESLAKENRRPLELRHANPVGSLMRLKRYPVIAGLVASLVLIYIAGHAVQSTWNFFVIEQFNWNPAMVGYSLGFAGLMVAIVQGGLMRFISPKLGQVNSIKVGLVLSVLGLILFSFASKGWMMFAFLIPYCLGGIAGPALQGLVSNQVPDNEQGELQGTLTSLVSVTSIVGPLLMTHAFAFTTGSHATFHFPGSPFMLGAILTTISILLARRTLQLHQFRLDRAKFAEKIKEKNSTLES